jgi:2-phospho-L-lactate guanylyltransferase (CobY/MobA/RfbA family)
MSVSIVIPIGHKDQNFEIIDQIKEKFKEYEVIVVSSYQNTEAKTLEEKVDQFLSIHNSSRAKAMNAGAEIAQNEMLWFLHLDSDLSLISSIDLERVDDEKINTFLLRFSDEKLKYNSIGANLRTKYLKLPFGDQSFLINKKLFNFLGEFTEGLEKGEDHEFIWKAKQLGIKINIIDNYILTSGIKYNANPIYQTLKTLKDTVIQILKFYKPKSKYVICHFLKDPKSKKSKTRLREQLEDDFVDKLNENLIEILTDNIKKLKTNRFIYQLTVSEKIHKKYAHKFSKITNGLYLTSQKDLGLSMKEVIDFNLRYFKKVVIVGSDIPLLTAQDIKDSLKNISG